jgi:hypothetical protein
MEATKMISSLSLGMSVLPGPGVAGGRQFPPGKIVPEPGVAGGRQFPQGKVVPEPGVAGGRQFPPGKIVPEPGVAGGGLLQKYHLFGLKPAEKQHTVGVRA